MFSVNIDQDELSRVIREAVRTEVEPLIRLLENRKLSVSEVKSLLSIKSSKTVSSLVRQGKLAPCPDRDGGRPKFWYKDVVKYKQSNMKNV